MTDHTPAVMARWQREIEADPDNRLCRHAMVTNAIDGATNSNLGTHVHTCSHPADIPHGHHLCPDCNQHWHAVEPVRAEQEALFDALDWQREADWSRSS